MKKHNKKEFGLFVLLIIGAAASVATVFITALALAVISSLTKNPSALVGAFSMLTLVLAGGISGFAISRVSGEGGALVGILSSVIASLLMMSVGLIWRGGLLPLGGLLNLLVFLAMGIISSLLGKKRPKRHRRTY